MKKFSLVSFLVLSLFYVNAQKTPLITAKYVDSLYTRYPVIKSDLCADCYLWVNPIYKSIANVVLHQPVITYYVYTREHRLAQEALDIPRSNEFAAWHPAVGQPRLDAVYEAANKEIGKPNSSSEIAYGHCQAWILLAWCNDGAILSDTQDFNEAMEYQGQNVGTEIATEDTCRRLTGWKQDAVADSVKIWCGTSGSQQAYGAGKIQVQVPAYYWKVISFYDKVEKQNKTICYWMPNEVTEIVAMLPKRHILYADLVTNLGFDPEKILQ